MIRVSEAWLRDHWSLRESAGTCYSWQGSPFVPFFFSLPFQLTPLVIGDQKYLRLTWDWSPRSWCRPPCLWASSSSFSGTAPYFWASALPFVSFFRPFSALAIFRPLVYVSLARSFSSQIIYPRSCSAEYFEFSLGVWLINSHNQSVLKSAQIKSWT